MVKNTHTMRKDGSNNFTSVLIIWALFGFSLGAQNDSVFVKYYKYNGKLLKTMVEDFSEIITTKYNCNVGSVLSLDGSKGLDTLYLRQFPAFYVLENMEFGTTNVIRVDSIFIVFDPSRITKIGEHKIPKTYDVGNIPVWALNNSFQCAADTVPYLDYLNTWVSFVISDESIGSHSVHYPKRKKKSQPKGLFTRIKNWFRRVF